MTRGFYIGRFQPFHNGHRAMVEHIVEEVDELVLGIGSADVSHTVRNPFTAGERVMMVTKAVEDVDVPTYVVPIEDIDRNAVWVSHIMSMSPSFDVAYSNNPLVVQLFEERGIEVRQSPMFDRERLEGSDIRDRMLDDDTWNDRVPDVVADVIDEFSGVQRLQTVAKDDVSQRWEAEEDE
ncbi:nicotinamide-nucleotide adenylyltransferase [Halosimplex salinum]|uniref:nicotinamide-nucleotide adenylyltransferase n=1 Tax=Halosimplex salinum TaxID=1710538 RepID=UPI000F4A64FF|nr:nicotinamide-nucleotide adenylyltransferase [Halosimplex salinum]